MSADLTYEDFAAREPQRMEWLRQVERHSTAIHDSFVDLIDALVEAVDNPKVTGLHRAHKDAEARYQAFHAAHPDGRVRP